MYRIDPYGVIQGDPGDLVIINGDGSGQQLRVTDANLAYGSPLAIGDLTGDGTVEIIGVRQYENSQFFTSGDYVVAAWDVNGNELWESEHFINTDFSFASAPIIYDFEGDGDSEIVVGHVILNSDGSVRGVGEHGIGSYGIVELGGVALVETAIPAVTDLDLDGDEDLFVVNGYQNDFVHFPVLKENFLFKDIHNDSDFVVKDEPNFPNWTFINKMKIISNLKTQKATINPHG